MVHTVLSYILYTHSIYLLCSICNWEKLNTNYYSIMHVCVMFVIVVKYYACMCNVCNCCIVNLLCMCNVCNCCKVNMLLTYLQYSALTNVVFISALIMARVHVLYSCL